MQLYLRIAPELYLKRLVIGGMERVFEINRSFRNEGISTRHNPEFTMLEFYEAYQDYTYLMDFTETMLREVAIKVLETTKLIYQGREIDLAQPFERLTITQAIQKFHPEYTDAQLGDRSFLVKNSRRSESVIKPRTASAGYSLHYLTKPPSICCLSQPSSSTIQPRFRRWRGATMQIPR